MNITIVTGCVFFFAVLDCKLRTQFQPKKVYNISLWFCFYVLAFIMALLLILFFSFFFILFLILYCWRRYLFLYILLGHFKNIRSKNKYVFPIFLIRCTMGMEISRRNFWSCFSYLYILYWKVSLVRNNNQIYFQWFPILTLKNFFRRLSFTFE